jgi:3-hydroxy-3-methylglutaryl CoA synthase
LTIEVVTGITGFGAFVPRRRLQRAAIADAHAWAFPSLKSLGKGERAICSWDEDVITMAVEAGRDCLLGSDRESCAALTLASTTAPYADANNAALVAAALRLPLAASALDAGGSTRSSLSALADACHAASGTGSRLVIASERRRAKPGSVQEMQYGCGAAAVVCGRGDSVIARLLGRESITVPFIDHFRKSGQATDYGWEERWIRDEGVAKLVPQAVARLLDRLKLDGDRVSWFGLSGAPVRADSAVAKKLKISLDRVLPDLQGRVGDTGTAHPLLQLVGALERAQPGDIIVVAAFGQGCEVAAFEMLQPAPATGRRGLAGNLEDRIEESAYLKLLSNDGHLELDWGMRAESDHKTALTQLYRSADQIFGFVGGQCSRCNAVQFPRLPSCVNCGSTETQTPYALADAPAKVATYTADWLQYSPSPPLYMGLIQFDNGARLLMEITDVSSQGIDVGTPVSMSFRIKERDRLRGWDRYFWKATPAR